MVAAANRRNEHEKVTGILLFNGLHFFQLLEGPEESVKSLYQQICKDIRHHNVVELLCDYSHSRRFGKVGMELFDLRKHGQEDVLQAVLDKGTSRYQLTYHDRALQFFRTFVTADRKNSFYEIPPVETWRFCTETHAASKANLLTESGFSFIFQPMVDPLAKEIVSLEARNKTPQLSEGQGLLPPEETYHRDLKDKKEIFARAKSLELHSTMLAVSLMPMTLVKIPGAVDFLLNEIETNGLVPEQIIMQFSEREVISQFAEFAGAVKQLKAAGISIAIDDFGAGFAGLQLLAQFQPDRLKINRHLIADVHKSGPRQAIIHDIIQCCSCLEIQVSADGVEVAEEWMWLESAGIEHFQGPLFSQPEYGLVPPISWPERNSDDII